LLLASVLSLVVVADSPSWLAPSALVLNPDGHTLYVAGGRAPRLLALALPEGTRLWSQNLADCATGLAWADGPSRLIVTCGSGSNVIEVFAPADSRRLASWPAGHGVCSPVVAPQSHRLFVCNRFDHLVSVRNLNTGRELARIPVLGEPVAAALSPDERLLVVANHLPEGAANLSTVAAAVTLIDTRSRTVRAHVRLPNGSTSLAGVAIHPSGRWAGVVHNIGRFQVPTTQVEFGWMNVSALSLIDLEQGSLAATVLLDEPRRGAANPWAIAWSADGATLGITHAGTHELSFIDSPALLQKLQGQMLGKLVENLDYLKGIRQRLPLAGQGPRSMVLAAQTAYVGEFFSDAVSVVDLSPRQQSGTLRLEPEGTLSPEREGERLFHDATLAHQSWQSCVTCHPDGRADGLNWDLLNDGLGNPKNTKSLLLCFQTPPAMSLGERTTAKEAVRSGLRHILFAVPAEPQAQAIDAYLRSLRPVPSPFLDRGRLTASAKRGQRVFDNPRVGCAVCHPPPLFTDQKSHRVGIHAKGDRPADSFDTPTLIECWRTAPYFHDGSAVIVREVFTTKNINDEHGRTVLLSAKQIDDLVAYVLSL
jgi:DNA-binding beta-propeller fold protein YncE